MLAPKQWLERYVDIKKDSKELRDRMTMSGSNVEDIRNYAKSFNGVVIGQVKNIKVHENADKLVVVKVDIGTKLIQVVTGATNFKTGDFVPVALEGAALAGGIRIEKGELRGELSEGMMCSHDELGIAKNLIPEDMKDGLWILNGEYQPGIPFEKALSLNDDIFEFEITPNRSDCLNIIGISREIAATLNVPITYPEIKFSEAQEKNSNKISIQIDDPEGCPRYIGRILDDVKVEPSPDWLQILLMKAGIRPINNIVDVTNYVMLEYGQPLHAFDLEKIPSRKIVVKKAEGFDTFKTLDGVERKLPPNATLITDGSKPLAVAGIMGGLDSEVDNKTQQVLLESANFDADLIRESSKRLNLRTEASSRFEKGVDKETALTAINRACQLIQQLSDCKVLREAIDEYPNPFKKNQVNVRISRINQLLGTHLSTKEITDIFQRLEISVKETSEGLQVIPPSFRKDLVKEIDFVEEVARIYGYDRIRSTMPEATITVGGVDISTKVQNLIKRTLTAQGLLEVLTYSFVSPKSISKIGISTEKTTHEMIQLRNPLGEETSAMRTTLMPGMMEVLARNYKNGNAAMKAFEMGRTFIKDPESPLPTEKTNLVLGRYGKEEDFFKIKGTVEEMLKGLRIKKLVFVKEPYHPTFHPGRCANAYFEDKLLGTIGEVHPEVSAQYGIDHRCYLAELNIEEIMTQANLDKKYQPLPKYPPIQRDIAFVVEEKVEIGKIEKIFDPYLDGILESYELFDVYQGDQIDKGLKSVAYALVYRDYTKTLEEHEVSKVHKKILQELEEKVQASLR